MTLTAVANTIKEDNISPYEHESEKNSYLSRSILFAVNTRESLKTLESIHHELINGMHVLTTLSQLHAIYSEISKEANRANAYKVAEVSAVVSKLTNRVMQGDLSLTSNILGIFLKAKSVILILLSLFENNEVSDIDSVNNFVSLAEKATF